MKRILAVCFAAILMLTFVFSVFAHDHSGMTANLDVKYEYDEENNRIIVTANIVDIKDKTGISLIEYKVTYNHSNLALKESKVAMPEAWKAYLDSGYAEDLSFKKKDGVYIWSVMVFEPSVAVKKDNELNLVLVFDVKNKKSSEIEFVNESSANADLELIAIGSATINVNFGGDDTPSIEVSNTEPSVPDIPSKEDPAPTDSTDEPDNGTNLPEQSTDDGSDSASLPDNDNSVGYNSDESNEPNHPDEFTPPVLTPPVQSEDSEFVLNDSEIESNVSVEDDNGNVGIYVLIVGIILVIVGVVIVILVLRNNGKDK